MVWRGPGLSKAATQPMLAAEREHEDDSPFKAIMVKVVSPIKALGFARSR